VIAVVGAAGTIGRNVVRFLEEWKAPVVRRDARLEGTSDSTLPTQWRSPVP
jgi:nucleoside-diphosphate-sugar epimerase